MKGTTMMSHGKFTIFERDFLVEFIQDELHRDANQYSTIPSVTDADADKWTDTMIVQYLTENKYDWRLMLDTENNRLWDEEHLMTTPIDKSRIELTIGERIHELHATQELTKFPAGSAPYARASKDSVWMRSALIVHMVSEGITHARTKVATATLDEYGWLTVEKYEVAM
jgi:hypothetical protein